MEEDKVKSEYLGKSTKVEKCKSRKVYMTSYLYQKGFKLLNILREIYPNCFKNYGEELPLKTGIMVDLFDENGKEFEEEDLEDEEDLEQEDEEDEVDAKFEESNFSKDGEEFIDFEEIKE